MHSPKEDDVAWAWAFFVVQNQGVPMDICKSPGNWGRAFLSTKNKAMNVNRWLRRIDLLPLVIDRFRRVQVDNRDALDVIRYWDSPDTVFYVDPPYVAETRTKGKYRHECDDDHHRELVRLLCEIKGKAMISGYDSPLYGALNERYDLRKIKTVRGAAVCGRNSGLQGKGAALAKVPRTECVWTSREDGNGRLF